MRIPDKATFTSYFTSYCFLSIVFAVVYGGTNYLASLREHRATLYLPIEQHIPFVPQFIFVYLSVFAVFVLPVFYIKQSQVLALSKAFLFSLLVAALFHLLVPLDLAHVRSNNVEFMPGLFQLLYWFALPHNLMPSLHITFTVLFLGLCIALEPVRLLRAALYVWGVLLFLSVLLMHQHQLIDIPTGSLLGWVAYKFIFKRSQR